MITFKYIDIPKYQQIVDEIRSVLDLEALKKSNLTFIQLDQNEFLPKCHLLTDYLTAQNLHVVKTVVVRVDGGGENMTIHVDNCNAKNWEEYKFNYSFTGTPTRDVLGLQIGLENVEDTYTAFYRVVSGEITKVDGIYSTAPIKKINYPSMRFERCVMEEIDRYIATKPLIFNATVPHTVINPTDKTRLVLTLRFDPDPWHLVQ